jgi:thiol:disulfide interchange protein DsbD
MEKTMIRQALIIATLAIAASSAAFAQFGAPKNILTAEAKLSRTAVAPGDVIKVAAVVSIKDEYHINSNAPRQDFLIPTKLALKAGDGATIERVVYPKSHDITLGFSDEPLAVYEGEVVVGALARVSESAAPGTISTTFELSYQGCDDKNCYPPQSIELPVEIVVGDRTGEEINADVFNRVALDYPAAATTTDEEEEAAEEETDDARVELETYLSHDKTYAGASINLLAVARTEEGVAVVSDRPTDERLVGARLDVASADGIIPQEPTFSDDAMIEFPFSDEPIAVFADSVSVGVALVVPDDLAPGVYPIAVSFYHQTVDDKGERPPTTALDTAYVVVAPTSEPSSAINVDRFADVDILVEVPDESVEAEDDEGVASALRESGLFLGLLLVFLGGLALNLTPCVYPLIPITVGYFGGQSEGSSARLAGMGALYVLGLSVTYSIIGVATSLSGGFFGALLQNPIALSIVALVLVALSLSMFGVYEFKLPDSWMSAAGGSRTGLLGAGLMGLTMGIVAAPCIGPFVIGLAAYVGALGDPLQGFLLFFFLALGLGTPYFFLAIFSGKLKSLPRSGEWMEAVKHIFGFVLLGMALYFIEPILPDSVAPYALPGFMIVAALWLAIFDRAGMKSKGFAIFKYVFSAVVLAVGVFLLVPSSGEKVEWTPYDDAAYEAALEAGEPIIVDFYADWCVPCKEFDAITFRDPAVIEATADFTTLKADVTQAGSEATERLVERFNVNGVPTVLIFDATGEEVARITGFLPPEDFLERVERAR